MSKPTIVCVDDQREVLSALIKELSFFEPAFSIEGCESTAEAREVLSELDAKGTPIALLICDHVMPQEKGIDFLSAINGEKRFAGIAKILLTGQANQDETIQAINDGGIDNYISKPWDADDLQKKARVLITSFLMKSDMDHTPYLAYLDQDTLYKNSAY